MSQINPYIRQMTGYVKIYGNQLMRSTVWVNTSKETKLLWITMLAIADKNGLVLASIPGLAKEAGISLAECEESIGVLCSPDPYSRTKKYEGRRLEVIDGGFLLLNYKKYREMRTEAQVKEAERKAAWRAKQSEKAAEGHVTGQPDVPSSPTKSRATPTPSPPPSPTPEEEASSSQDIDRYYISCTIALNHGMQENPTVEGDWMPVAASSQVARVTWYEDGIPLGIVEEIVLERSKAYRCSAQNRGPRSLKYFDLAVRETWERGQQSASDAKVSEVLGR